MTTDNADEKANAVRVCALLVLDLDRANPELGWGMSSKSAVEEAIRLLGYGTEDVDVEQLSSVVQNQRQKRGL